MCKETKIKKLEKMIETLESGKDVPRKVLKSVLTDEEIHKLDECWLIEKTSRNKKPDQIKEYEKRLGVALRKYGLCEAAGSRFNPSKRKKLYENCDHLFEKLIEFANELVYSDENLILWFDRPIMMDGVPEPDTIPRTVTSKSPKNRSPQKSNYPVYTKRDLKKIALYSCLEKLIPHEQEEHEDVFNLRGKNRKVMDTSRWIF